MLQHKRRLYRTWIGALLCCVITEARKANVTCMCYSTVSRIHPLLICSFNKWGSWLLVDVENFQYDIPMTASSWWNHSRKRGSLERHESLISIVNSSEHTRIPALHFNFSVIRLPSWGFTFFHVVELEFTSCWWNAPPPTAHYMISEKPYMSVWPVRVIPEIWLHFWSHCAVVVFLGQLGLHLLHVTRAGLSSVGQSFFIPSTMATTQLPSLPSTLKMSAHSCIWRCVFVYACVPLEHWFLFFIMCFAPVVWSCVQCAVQHGMCGVCVYICGLCSCCSKMSDWVGIMQGANSCVSQIQCL